MKNPVLLVLALFLSVQGLMAQSDFKADKNGKMVYHDNKGKKNKDIAFDQAIFDDVAKVWRVNNGDKWGLVNNYGVAKPTPKYNHISEFKGSGVNASALIQKGNLFGAISPNGNILLAPEYEEVEHLDTDPSIFKVKKNGKWGLINFVGVSMAPIEFDQIDSYENGQAILSKNGKSGKFKNGKFISDSGELNEGEFPYPDKKAMMLSCKGQESNCTARKLMMDLSKNLVYPEVARELDIEGTVVLELTFDKEGMLVNKRITESLGFGCDEEVLKFADRLPKKWIPAYQNDKAIPSQLSFPIEFKLQR